MACNRKNKTCAGDLNKPITILLRKLKPKEESFKIDLEKVLDCMAEIKTISQYRKFHDTNIEPGNTHKITIHYVDDIDSDFAIKYLDDFYIVKQIKNPDEENLMLELYCRKTGPISGPKAGKNNYLG